MKKSATEKLEGLGLDVKFLAWLEGDDQRLPDLDKCRNVRDADYAAAIRATEWLGQYSAQPEIIAPRKPDEWRSRYELLQQYLLEALKNTMFFHALSAAQDLETLERVVTALGPADAWAEHGKDILHLRQRGLPESLETVKAKPSGGHKQTEPTTRMRAAFKYISSVSQTPYADLARFWNEQLGQEKYTSNQIKDRLRKGHPLSTRGERWLEYWQRIYRGDFRAVFPGQFPLNSKMQELLPRRNKHDPEAS